MPHWTDPPTGEVPRILAGEARRRGAGRGRPGSVERARSPGDALARRQRRLGRRATRSATWASDEPAVGALDQTRTEHSDLYSFDEEFERVEAERIGRRPRRWRDFDQEFEAEPEPVRTRTRPAPPPRPGARTGAHSPVDRQPGAAAARRPGATTTWQPCRRRRRPGRRCSPSPTPSAPRPWSCCRPRSWWRPPPRPTGCSSAPGSGPPPCSGWWPPSASCSAPTGRAIEALPLAVVLVFAGSMMWYLLRIVEARPLANVAVTIDGLRLGRGARLLRVASCCGPTTARACSWAPCWSPLPPTSAPSSSAAWIGSPADGRQHQPQQDRGGLRRRAGRRRHRRRHRRQGAHPLGRHEARPGARARSSAWSPRPATCSSR